MFILLIPQLLYEIRRLDRQFRFDWWWDLGVLISLYARILMKTRFSRYSGENLSRQSQVTAHILPPGRASRSLSLQKKSGTRQLHRHSHFNQTWRVPNWSHLDCDPKSVCLVHVHTADSSPHDDWLRQFPHLLRRMIGWWTHLWARTRHMKLLIVHSLANACPSELQYLRKVLCFPVMIFMDFFKPSKCFSSFGWKECASQSPPPPENDWG